MSRGKNKNKTVMAATTAAARTGPTKSERKRALYGTDRVVRQKEIRDKLQRSHVLQDGEYNFTPASLKQGIWRTSFQTDFPGTGLDRSYTVAGTTQLDHHFRLGNDSGTSILPQVYRQSTTKADYEAKTASRPKIIEENRTVNWPDMAPHLAVNRTIGSSEYANSFMAGRSSSAPVFPKVNTAIMKLPLDPSRFWVQRDSNFRFGHDPKSLLSEHQRAYGRSSKGETLAAGNGEEAAKANKAMRDMQKASHIFLEGDYNGHVNDFKSINVCDYGPRTKHPAEILASEVLQKEQKAVPVVNQNVPNQLTSYARSVIVPEVHKDASDGKKYHISTHFDFGLDPGDKQSMYGKDFAQALKGRAKPSFYVTPDAGKLFQEDPHFSKTGNTTHKTDHVSLPPAVGPTVSKKLTEVNQKKHESSVHFSFDPTISTEDRQKSLSHQDYVGIPKGYRPPLPRVAQPLEHDYLQADDALPYPERITESEAKNNFSGAFMEGMHALERRRTRDTQCRDRLDWGRATHFTVGYEPQAYYTEHGDQYEGRAKTDKHTKAAGVTETAPDKVFNHLAVSVNLQDMRAADPHQASSKESLKARGDARAKKAEKAFESSVMKSDYTPLHQRGLTEDQVKSVQKFQALVTKPFEHAHLFHTDSTGRNNFQTTAMEDYIKPEDMTGGRKYLAAR